MPIWTPTVPARPTRPVAPTLAALPPPEDETYAGTVAANATALAAYQMAENAWQAAVAAIEAIERQPVKAVHGITDIGGGQFRADIDLDLAGTVDRCFYVYRPGSPDASAAHTQLASLHAGGAFTGHITAPAGPTTADLVAYAAAKRWAREVGGCVVDGHQVATDRDSQSKYLAEFVAIGAGLRTDPSPWKFADGEFAVLTNAQMGAVIMGVRAHVAAAFAAEMTVHAAVDAGTITTTAEVDAAF